MNFTLHQLQIFLKIAELKSITKASEELHLTQPAVSIQLKNFQDQFSIPLTEIVGRQLYVTDFGAEIVLAAQKIIEEVDAIHYKTLSFKGKLTGRIKMSVVSTGKYVMPYFIAEFLKINDAVDLKMDVTNKSKVIQSLEENKVDFALVSVLPKKLKLNNISLMENKLYFIASSKLKYTEEKDAKEIFQELPLIYREQGSATRNAMEKFISNNNFSVTKTIELTSNEAVKQAVLAGLGCSIMPIIGIRNELRSGELQMIPFKGLPLVTAWNLVWLQSKKLSPAAAAYIKFLNQDKEQVIQEYFSWTIKDG